MYVPSVTLLAGICSDLCQQYN